MFRCLRARYYDTVRLMVTRNDGTEEDAEDILSEGMADLIAYFDDPAQELKSRVDIHLLSDQALTIYCLYFRI